MKFVNNPFQLHRPPMLPILSHPLPTSSSHPTPTPSRTRTLRAPTLRPRNVVILTKRILRPGRLTYILTARIRRAGTALWDRAKSKHTAGVDRTRGTSTGRACEIGVGAESGGLEGCVAEVSAAGVEFAVGGADGGAGTACCCG